MTELAYNVNGETFTPPETAVSWGARKMKERGAPEVAYGRNGLPAQVPIDATHEMLRNALTEPGRYRLDAMDEHGRRIEGAQPAYVHVPTIVPVAAPAAAASVQAIPDRDVIVAEAMRHNTELARAVVDRFPEMMHAAAELLRAADGAGLPARAALVQTTTTADADADDDDSLDAEPSIAPAGAFGIDLNRIIGDVVKDVIGKLFEKGMPSFAEMTDWGDTRAKPKAIAAPVSAVIPAATGATQIAASGKSADGATPAPTAETAPQLDASQMRQMVAVYTALSPTDAKLARQLVQELTPAERQQWIADLSTLSVPDAVAKVRAVLGTDAEKGAVS